MKFVRTIVTISVHGESDNPMFGETATHVSLEDEAGGAFIKLTQSTDLSSIGEVRLSFEEWDEVALAVLTLKNQEYVK